MVYLINIFKVFVQYKLAWSVFIPA